MRRGIDAERNAIKAKQKETARRRRLAAKVNAKKRKATKKKKMIAKGNAVLKARNDKLPKTCTAAMCGEVGAKGLAARVLCLDRLKLYSSKVDP